MEKLYYIIAGGLYAISGIICGIIVLRKVRSNNVYNTELIHLKELVILFICVTLAFLIITFKGGYKPDIIDYVYMMSVGGYLLLKITEKVYSKNSKSKKIFEEEKIWWNTGAFKNKK